MFEGHEEEWDNLSTSNPPYLKVSRGADNQLPRREAPPQSSPGNLNYMARADNDMRDVTGIFSQSLGAPSNVRSGRGINALKLSSNTNIRIYIDNWIEGLLEVGSILLEWIPIIYDTERVFLIMGEEGIRTPVRINQKATVKGEPVIINDIKQGVYDYVIQGGASNVTNRQDQLLAILEFTQTLPPEMKMMFSDLLAELSNMPIEIVDRMKSVVQSLQQGPAEEAEVEVG
jgi:hypothetical protein